MVAPGMSWCLVRRIHIRVYGCTRYVMVLSEENPHQSIWLHQVCIGALCRATTSEYMVAPGMSWCLVRRIHIRVYGCTRYVMVLCAEQPHQSIWLHQVCIGALCRATTSEYINLFLVFFTMDFTFFLCNVLTAFSCFHQPKYH